MAPLIIQAVLVRFEENCLAISLSGNVSWNNGMSSSEASGMLCWTNIVATFTSVCIT